MKSSNSAGSPSPIGPVPGVGWEDRREGVDDVRYLQLLEARVAADRQDDATAQEANDWLSKLQARVHSPEFDTNRHASWGTDYMDPNHKIAPDEYDAIRTKVADFIMKLFPAAGEQNPEPAEWLRLQPAPLEADAYAEATVAECLQALNCGSVKQKRQAAGALAMRDADEILSARDRITGLLDDPMICMVALRALAKMGSEAASAIPHIDKLLNSNDVFVREAAI